MDVFLVNFNFIWINSFLALVAVMFGWLMLQSLPKLVRIFCGFCWLLFLPNTIYILTDVSHLLEDWPKVNNLFRLILVLQYTLFSIIGIITFAISVYCFQKLLEGKSADRKEKGIKITTIAAICILNFIVGFGVILGGIRRTNSWYVFTNPSMVLEDILNLIYSQELLILSLGVGILANLIYFLMLESVVTWGKKYLKK